MTYYYGCYHLYFMPDICFQVYNIMHFILWVVNGEQIIWIVKNKYNVYNNMDIQIILMIQTIHSEQTALRRSKPNSRIAAMDELSFQ